MRESRSSTVVVAILVGGLFGSRRLEAQAAPGGPERGCRGDEFAISWTMPFGTLVAFPVITVVPPGTPAALAGLQPGDSVVTVEGRDSRERPPKRSFAPGDTMKMTVRRQQADLPIVLVLGRTLEGDTGTGATPVCRPVQSASKP